MWVIGSPPYTAFCQMHVKFNFRRMPPERVQALFADGRLHLQFMAQIYERQIAAGRYFLHEHPSSAQSWNEMCIRRILDRPNVDVAISYQCEYGLLTPSTDCIMRPAMTPTKWMSSSHFMLDRLRRRCQRNHVHQHLIDGRAKAAENYPSELSVEMLRGMRDTADQNMHFDCDDAYAVTALALTPGHGFADVSPDLRAHHVAAVTGALSETNDRSNISVTYVGGRRQELTLGLASRMPTLTSTRKRS